MKIEEIDVEFAKIMQNLRYTNPEILVYIKNLLEKNLSQGYNFELKLIVDTNIILQESLALIKKGSSALISLSKSPFLKIFAPTWLLIELNKKMPDVAKENNIDEQVLRTKVEEIKKQIIISEICERDYTTARQILGERDPEGKDAPYVALYLSINAHGILTADKDIIEQKGIRTWNKVGFAGKIVSTFERGSASFLIIGKGIPITLYALYELTITILNGIWHVLKAIFNAVMSLAKAGFAAISELPGWVIVAFFIAAIAVASSERARKLIVENILEPIYKHIIDVLKVAYKIIKDVISFLIDILEISGMMLSYLFGKIENAFTYYEAINIGDSNVT